MTGGKAAVAAGTGQCEQSRHWTKPPGCGAWGSRSSQAAGRREPTGCWAGRARAAPPWHRRGRGPTGSHGDCGRSSAEKPGGPLTAPLGAAGQDVALAGHAPLTVLLEGPTGVRSHAPRTSTTLPSAVAAARDAGESKEGTRKKSDTSNREEEREARHSQDDGRSRVREGAKPLSLNELYSNQRVRGYQRHPRSPRKPTRTTAGCSGRPGTLRARTAGLGGHRPPRPGPTRRPQTRAAAGANDRVNERAKYPGEFL